jgi:hypothetical protein
VNTNFITGNEIIYRHVRPDIKTIQRPSFTMLAYAIFSINLGQKKQEIENVLNK